MIPAVPCVWRTLPAEGWGAFAAWAMVGSLLGFSVLSAASIGLFVLPVALLALAVTVRTARVWPEIAGTLEGIASVSLFVGLVNLDSTPCPSSGSGHVHIGGGPGTGTTSFSCGGLDPSPWLVAALAQAAAGFAVYALGRPRR